MTMQVERPPTREKHTVSPADTFGARKQTVAGRALGPAALPVDRRQGAGTTPAGGASSAGAPLARWLLARIDGYRARVAPTCSVCLTDPERSFSYRVRARVVDRGAMAGLLMLGGGWLVTHLSPRDTYGWRSGGIGAGRFDRGGW